MARTLTFKTDVNLSLSYGGDHAFVLSVGYVYRSGSKETYEEPGSAPSAEIVSIRLTRPKSTEELPVPAWLADAIEADEAFLDSLVTDAVESDQSERDDAAERRAEANRDDRLMGVR